MTDATAHRLRPERRTDDGFLFALYADVRRAEMDATGWPARQRQAFLRDQLRLQSLHYRRAYPAADFQIVEIGPIPVGRLYWHEGSDDIRLIEFSILSAYRNRGIGSALLEVIIARAAAGRKTASLQVAFGNRAIRLYRRFGFEIADSADSSGIVMRLEPATRG